MRVALIAFAFLAVAVAQATALPGPLAAKVAEIRAACGSKVVSAFRPGSRTPSGHLSLHATGQAVDMAGNPSCIYRHLRGWRGGYTTDYATAPGGAHVHISWGGREHGMRFAHRGGGTRYAARGSHASSARKRARQGASGQNNAPTGFLGHSAVP